MRRWFRAGWPVVVALLGSAHVGSREILYQGPAGEYSIRVLVDPPLVIPGAARVIVSSAQRGLRSVSLQPVRWDLGPDNAPAPEPARRDGDAYHGTVWLMSPGSYGLRVTVTGDRGEGLAVVPVSALALERKPLGPLGATLLTALLGVLAAGAIGIVRGVARTAALEPGAVVATEDARRGSRATIVATLTAVGLLVLWAGWWRRIDRAYDGQLYRPPPIEATVVGGERGAHLDLFVTLERGAAWRPLIADHGRAVHLFLVRDPGLDAVAHLHPRLISDTRFRASLPPLPMGRYRVFVDVVHDDGLAETMSTTFVLAAPTTVMTDQDPEDSWWTGSSTDGLRWSLDDASPVTGQPLDLRLQVRQPSGRPAELEPYLGMAGHALLMRADGAVFVHLHPEGTTSRAAQQRLGGGADGHQHLPASGVVAFPYVFPSAGHYRLWAQVRVAGAIRTAAFDLDVSAPD